MTKRESIRNIAIIAHVDHGKTTLVDAMLKQTHAVKINVETTDLIMDSMDLERERGITIKAKNASLVYKGIKINIVDTPGHADFGGEVERTLRMADGVLLLVDAKEGPMPQTKFVLKKAMELGLRAIVVINKIDKPYANVDEAVNKTFDLFVKLNATHEQLDFPIIYASGLRGLATATPEELAVKLADVNTSPDIAPLFESIVNNIPAPEVDLEDSFTMQVLALAYNNYKGRIGIGKVKFGKVKNGQQMLLVKADGSKTTAQVTSLQMYDGLKQVDVDEAEAGDIVAIGGFEEIHIGDIVTDPVNPKTMPPVMIEPPTIKMTFGVNSAPGSGKEGKFCTSRNIRDRLEKELETNVALKVEGLDQGTDTFLVSGRGELHLCVLIETMRREGFCLQVGQPQVIYIEENGVTLEPYETVYIDVPHEHQGIVIQELGKRGGEMQHMDSTLSTDVHAEYLIPTRGLLGLKNLLMTRTRGTVVINNLFDSYKPVHDIDLRDNEHGSLIAFESGISNPYGLDNAQERGVLFINPGVEVYEGMVVGKHSLETDLEVNACKIKHKSNQRAVGSSDPVVLPPPVDVTLDFAVEYVGPDELVDVTPKNIRIRKQILSSTERKRIQRKEK
ncbi:MAG: GTP-binding protein TypA [Candidatus Firestonebacteria bacterium RIFOXYC2_FULL_39_67]|nr:MAG: GTP-binding protein TypA [Candidatus Firestonebacteria bacterium RIFOXYD2_FULL_39_29]OGF57448.1 MAG: GTP-binding protein TypA [Candidatus Firestonebacteria bacterium RIFOXYC2_FULL_39_67]